METRDSRASSYAWTSILHGRDVILKGCKWRIGNDKSVSIWQDFSLPQRHTPQVWSTVIELLVDAKVDMLIDASNWQWDHGLIDGIFTPEEVEVIKQIPLSQVEAVDSLFWPFTQRGEYTCKSVSESALHALWTCQELDVVWENEDLWLCRWNNVFMDFKELLSWLVKHQQNVELFFITTWSMWTQRNQVRLNQPSCSSHLLASMAKERLEEFLAVQPPPRTRPMVIRSQWQPPSLGLVKINFDGAVFSKENKSGIGVVISDDYGLVMALLAKQLPRVHSPLEIKALIVSTTLQFASNLGCFRG
ncbi:hypothetical protein ACB092_05G065900 [Castanea dentata]